MAYFLGQAKNVPADPILSRVLLLEAFPGIGGWEALRRLPSEVVARMTALVNARGTAQRIRERREEEAARRHSVRGGA